MKNLISFVLTAFLSVALGNINAQVGINTDGSSPNPSAIMDVKSSDKGMLVPRMSSTQRGMISNPAIGLLVFDTDTESFWFKNANEWVELVSGNIRTLADDDDDTKIVVDDGTDKDTISFNIAGTEYFTMKQGRIDVNNTGRSVLLGFEAGMNDDFSDNRNVAIGEFALKETTNGRWNTAIGYSTLKDNELGDENVAIGFAALSKSKADENTAIGGYALTQNTGGIQNTALGSGAGQNNQGSGNLFLGYNAGKTAGGDNKLYIENSDTTEALIYGEFDNDLVRINGDLEVDGDSYSIIFNDDTNSNEISNSIPIPGSSNDGFQMRFDVKDATPLILKGDGRVQINEVYQLPNEGGIEGHVMRLFDNGNANWGFNTLMADDDGDTRVQVDENELDEDEVHIDLEGQERLVLRRNANGNTILDFINSGGNTLLIGNNAGNTNTGNNNTFIGSNTGLVSTGGANTFIGNSAGENNLSGRDNIFIGEKAGESNTTGENNAFLGRGAGRINQTGEANTYLGAYAGLNATGSFNVFIGQGAGANETGSSKLYIDAGDTSSPLIYGEFNTNLVQINGNGTGNTYYPFTVKNTGNPGNARANGIRVEAGQNSNNSGSRFFACITPDGDEIGSIRQNGNSTVNFDTNSDIRLKTRIKPTQFGLKDLLQIEVRDYDFKAELGRSRTGFIAQQLHKYYPEAVSVGGMDEKKDPWGVDYGKLTPLLVQAIQDQQVIIEAQEEEINQLKSQNSRIERLEQQMAQYLSKDSATSLSDTEE